MYDQSAPLVASQELYDSVSSRVVKDKADGV